MEQFTGCEMQRTSQIVLLIFAWRHDLFLCPLWHPGCPDLRQQVNIEFIRKEHDLMGLQVFVTKPNAGQTLNPLWVIIFGHPLSSFSHAAYLVVPGAHGLRRALTAVFPLERRCERCTAPSVAAPALC